MKKLLLILALLVPISVSAHGGAAQITGNTVVFIKQNPLSPLIGEEVFASFVLRDRKDVSRPLPNTPVRIRLIDTFYGDESKDQIILTKNIKTDANGAFEFRYTFNKQNYFDIDLTYDDPETGEELETGYLVYPRDPREVVDYKALPVSAEQKEYSWILVSFTSGIIGLIAGVLLRRKLK